MFFNKLFDLLIKYNFEVIKNKFNVFLYTRDRILSYIYMFAKFYIYLCKFKNTIPNTEIFQIKLNNRKALEQKISLKNDKIEQFKEIWDNLRDFNETWNLFNVLVLHVFSYIWQDLHRIFNVFPI